MDGFFSDSSSLSFVRFDLFMLFLVIYFFVNGLIYIFLNFEKKQPTLFAYLEQWELDMKYKIVS